MAEDIYEPIVTYLQGKTDFHKVQNVEPTIVPNVPKSILDIYNKFTLFCVLMHNNDIRLLNIIFKQIMLATKSMIKNRKVNNN